MKKSTIVFVELGMFAGIVITGYTLPGTTPLLLFLVVSASCFVVGNILLVRKIKQIKAGETPAERGPWTHIFRALVILTIFWLVSFLVFSKH